MPGIDDNGKAVAYGVSHRDGKTLIPIAFTPTGKILFDTVTTILFDPAFNGGGATDNDRVVAHATSIDDNTTVMPWVVNDEGRVLVQF